MDTSTPRSDQGASVGRRSAALIQLSTSPPTDWQEQARCGAVDASVFFPPPHHESKAERLAREAEAKAICADCVVRSECLEWALTVGETFGVWGGHSEAERRQLLRDQQEQQAG